MSLIAGTQSGEKPGNIVLRYLRQRFPRPRREMGAVAVEIPSIGSQRVGGQPAFDRQVIEVAA